MKKRMLFPAQAIVLILVALLLSCTVLADQTDTAPEGFTGIYDADGLLSILPDGKYILLNDIDMSGTFFTPIGTASAPFTGVFNGNGHTISGLEISSNAPYSAMFAYADGAEIRNLTLDDASIVISASTKVVYAAEICTSAANATVISSCSVTGTVDVTANADVYAAGICAYSNGAQIKACSSDTDINVSTSGAICSVGGIAGYLFADSSVSDCENYGALSGISSDESYIGGIAGISKRDLNNTSKAKPSVSKSFNHAEISISTKKNISVSCAGIAAKAEHLVINGCKNTGDITVSCPIGATAAGISGYQSRNSISESANLGSISATSTGADAYAGGIIGEANVATVRNSYNQGSVFASGKQSTNSGGIIGYGTQGNKTEYCYNSGTNNSEAGTSVGTLIGAASYNDTRNGLFTLESNTLPAIGNRTDTNAITILTASEMKDAESFEGFDFDNIWYMPTESENGYPELIALKPADPDPIIYGDVDGNGTVDSNDSVVLARFLAKWTGYTEINEDNSNLNQDTVVDSSDSVILARYLAKWSGYEVLPIG